MPLAHFVAEARKHTPVSKGQTVEAVKKPEIQVSVPKEIPSAERTEWKRTMAEISDSEKVITEREKAPLTWKTCQYLKSTGDRHLCRQYMSFCAGEKCKVEFMETNFFDFKRHLKQGKTIK